MRIISNINAKSHTARDLGVLQFRALYFNDKWQCLVSLGPKRETWCLRKLFWVLQEIYVYLARFCLSVFVLRQDLLRRYLSWWFRVASNSLSCHSLGLPGLYVKLHHTQILLLFKYNPLSKLYKLASMYDTQSKPNAFLGHPSFHASHFKLGYHMSYVLETITNKSQVGVYAVLAWKHSTLSCDWH